MRLYNSDSTLKGAFLGYIRLNPPLEYLSALRSSSMIWSRHFSGSKIINDVTRSIWVLDLEELGSENA